MPTSRPPWDNSNLQSQVLMARTIRLAGRPSRAIEEHRELIDLIARRQDKAAQKVMERHILSALEDIVKFGLPKPVNEFSAGL